MIFYMWQHFFIILTRKRDVKIEVKFNYLYICEPYNKVHNNQPQLVQPNKKLFAIYYGESGSSWKWKMNEKKQARRSERKISQSERVRDYLLHFIGETEVNVIRCRHARFIFFSFRFAHIFSINSDSDSRLFTVNVTREWQSLSISE